MQPGEGLFESSPPIAEVRSPETADIHGSGLDIVYVNSYLRRRRPVVAVGSYPEPVDDLQRRLASSIALMQLKPL